MDLLPKQAFLSNNQHNNYMKNLKTINQLLDKISDLTLDEMTIELGEIRQQLIDRKKSHPKGGLLKVGDTDDIMEMIAKARLHSTQTATAPVNGHKAIIVYHPTV